MRTYDFSPLFRSTVGFDRLFDLLDNGARPGGGPTTLKKWGKTNIRLAWPSQDLDKEIELIQQGNTLTVTGQKDQTKQ